jgi:hypothetical protein
VLIYDLHSPGTYRKVTREQAMQRWISASFCQREDCVFVFNDIPASAIVTRTRSSHACLLGKQSSREERDSRRTGFSTYEHGEDKR